jgi:hypothetical protein
MKKTTRSRVKKEISDGWDSRRQSAREKSAKKSELTKAWKAREQKRLELLKKRLAESKNSSVRDFIRDQYITNL